MEPEEATETRTIRFRSYKPRDEQLQELTLEAGRPQSLIIQEEFDHEARTLVRPKNAPIQILPKRANWDLKRDLKNKTKPLNRQTQRAIAKLIRSRVGGDAETGADLSAAVDAQEREQQLSDDEDA